MKIHTVKTCCCGCTLRTGTLILLVLGVVGGTLGLLTGGLTFLNFLIHILIISVSATGIYGIQYEKPSLLKPFLACQVVGFVVGIIMMLTIAIFGVEFMSAASDNPEAEKVGAGLIIFLECAIVISEVVHYYFFVVVWSFYGELTGATTQ